MRSSTWTLLTGCSLGVIAVTALIVSIVHQVKETSAFRDESFKQGQMAKQSVNCPKAISYFTQVKETASFPFNAFDGLTDLAQQQIAICDAFMTANQQATQAKQQGNLSKALVISSTFVEQYPSDELTKATRSSITALFGNYKLVKLAGIESCDRVDNLVNAKVIPNAKSNTPLFYYSCGQFYAKRGQNEQELGQYRRFLTFAPRHSLSPNVQKAAVKNANMCSQTSTFQSIPAIAKLPSFMAVVDMNCSMAYYNAIDYPQSREFLKSLRKNYPKHSLAKVANNWLFSINQEIKTVKSEIFNSGETIKAKMIRCTTVGAFVGSAVDIMESLTGKSCGLEEPLEGWQRVVNIIPWAGEVRGAGKAKRLYDLIQVTSRWQGIDKMQSAVQDDEALFALLKDSEMITLLTRHNQKLEQLVMPRLNQPIDTSKNTQFLSYLK
jgi:tetratricopeptide (TPR) repeat protein